MGGPAQILAAAVEGLGRAEARLERAARRIAQSGDASSGQQDAVSLSEEFVSLIQARHSYMANLRAVEAGDEIERHILDLLG